MKYVLRPSDITTFHSSHFSWRYNWNLCGTLNFNLIIWIKSTIIFWQGRKIIKKCPHDCETLSHPKVYHYHSKLSKVFLEVLLWLHFNLHTNHSRPSFDTYSKSSTHFIYITDQSCPTKIAVFEDLNSPCFLFLSPSSLLSSSLLGLLSSSSSPLLSDQSFLRSDL